ncbi:MAG: hypothetical protein RJQ09_02875 [Cyclobacteriaceae bacterium]
MNVDPSVKAGAIVAVIESLLAVLIIFDILCWTNDQVAAVVGFITALANAIILIWIQRAFTTLKMQNQDITDKNS